MSWAGGREGSSLQRDEDGEVEISGGGGGVTVRSYWARECEGGGNLLRMEVAVQFFQGEGSWSSKMERLVTLCVLARLIAFCPPAEWDGGIPVWEGCLDEGMLSVDQGACAVVLEA